MKPFWLVCFAITAAMAYADTCEGSKTCPGPPEEQIRCSLTIPSGGSCEISNETDYIECIAYDAQGGFDNRDIAYCHGVVGGGAPSGDPTLPACVGVSGAWWVGCNPFSFL